jgi:hypothetical protein
MYLNIPFEELTTFYYGAEGVSATFASNKVYALDNANAQSYVSKIAKYENSDNPKEIKIVDIALNKSMITDYTTLQNATATQASDNFGTAQTVAYGTNYLYTTTIKFNSFNMDYGNGAHITFNFVNSGANGTNTRFLIWDVKSDNTFYYVPWTPDHSDWNNRKNVTDGVAVTAGTTSIKVQILVTDDNAYLFVDGVLRCAWLNMISDSHLEAGTEAMSVTFSENTVYKSGSSTYAEYLAKVSTYEAETGTTSKSYIDIGV